MSARRLVGVTLKKKSRNPHGLGSNILFMFREQWHFEHKAFLYPVIYIIFDLASAFLAIWMPKKVLDLIEQSVTSAYFILMVCIMTAGMMLFQYVSHYSKQSVFKSTVKILNQHFYMKKDWKVLDMDYELLSSPEGRVMTEKAHYAINRNIFVNMASFYPNVTDLLKNLAGLGTFSAVLFTLHPGIIFILTASYIADALVSFYVQKWEHKMKDARTKTNNKLYYILDEIKGLSYAKEIRAYGMQGWLDHSYQKFKNEKINLEKQVQQKYLYQGLFETFLYLIRNGGGYLFLIWRMFATDMAISDFVFYFGVITGFVQWLDQIILCYKNITNANFLIEDFRNLQCTKDSSNRKNGHMLPDLNAPVTLVLQDVCFQYEGSERMILDHINLTVKRERSLQL